jgi:hypothetical protein
MGQSFGGMPDDGKGRHDVSRDGMRSISDD